MTRTRVVLLTLGDPDRVTGGYLFHRRLADRAAEFDMAITFVSIPDGPLPYGVVSGPGWLRDRAVREAHVVVVDSIAAAAAAPWLGRVRVPVMAMIHQPVGGMDSGRLGRWARIPLDRWAYRRANPLMVASEWLVEQLVAARIPRRKLRVVPPGKDPEADSVSAQPGVPSITSSELRQGRQMAAVCVANWLPRKGIVELLDAVAALPDDLVTLHLVGDASQDSSYGPAVHKRLGREDLRSRVVVHGLVSARVVAQMYLAVDAFALPSFVEPYGTVWGEAMAAGLPVIGWRAGNLPFLVDHEREGLLVPVGDINALSEALARAARDPAMRERMGSAARTRAASRPTWDETASLFFTEIRQVLGRPRDRRPGRDR